METYSIKDILSCLWGDFPIYADMIDVLERNTGHVIYLDTDGILIREQRSGTYLLTARNKIAGRKLLGMIDERSCKRIFVHEEFLVPLVRKKLGAIRVMRCRQGVYTGINRVEVNYLLERSGVSYLLEVKKLDESYLDEIVLNYNELPEKEIHAILRDGKMFGGFIEKKLAGFSGIHVEGSTGCLNTLYGYGGMDLAYNLEGFAINYQLENKMIPYVQVEISNTRSFTIQSRLGFDISPRTMCWCFLDDPATGKKLDEV